MSPAKSPRQRISFLGNGDEMYMVGQRHIPKFQTQNARPIHPNIPEQAVVTTRSYAAESSE